MPFPGETKAPRFLGLSLSRLAIEGAIARMASVLTLPARKEGVLGGHRPGGLPGFTLPGANARTFIAGIKRGPIGVSRIAKRGPQIQLHVFIRRAPVLVEDLALNLSQELLSRPSATSQRSWRMECRGLFVLLLDLEAPRAMRTQHVSPPRPNQRASEIGVSWVPSAHPLLCDQGRLGLLPFSCLCLLRRPTGPVLCERGE